MPLIILLILLLLYVCNTDTTFENGIENSKYNSYCVLAAILLSQLLLCDITVHAGSEAKGGC